MDEHSPRCRPRRRELIVAATVVRVLVSASEVGRVSGQWSSLSALWLEIAARNCGSEGTQCA